MVTVLEHEFYLSEILDRRVFVKKQRIGRLGDLAIVETGKLPEVTHIIVTRPFGYPRLTVPWDKVLLISNNEVVLDIDEQGTAQFERAPQENLILLLNDKAAMGERCNSLRQNLIGGFIVVSIIVLSTLYGVSVLFPNLFT